MFTQEQALQKKLLSQQPANHASKYKHLLTAAIHDLSIQIQKTGHITTSSTDIGLKIEHDAVSYIESLILDVFMSILFSPGCSQNMIQTPETAYSEAMSIPLSTSTSTISTSATISSFNSVDSNATSILSTGSYRSFVSSGSGSNDSAHANSFIPIQDLSEAKLRVEQLLPHSYAETACSKAYNIVEKCRPFLNSTKRINKLLKTFSESQQNSGVTPASNLSETLSQLIKFPLDKIHAILVKESMNKKI